MQPSEDSVFIEISDSKCSEILEAFKRQLLEHLEVPMDEKEDHEQVKKERFSFVGRAR